MLDRGRLRALLAMLGPAFVAAVAYVDPGNFATNIQGGAKYGYQLLWVVLVANLIAMLVQYLSAKLGIVSGRSLPEVCRRFFPRWSTWGLWIQAEVMAMATDVAEFLGAAIGLNLLFGVPLLHRRADHRGDRVRDPRAPAPRLPGLRAGDRRAAGDRAARLPLRDAEDRSLGTGRAARPDPASRRRQRRLPGRGDRRGDGHAARDLSALGADQVARGDAQRRRAPACCAISAST